MHLFRLLVELQCEPVALPVEAAHELTHLAQRRNPLDEGRGRRLARARLGLRCRLCLAQL